MPQVLAMGARRWDFIGRDGKPAKGARVLLLTAPESKANYRGHQISEAEINDAQFEALADKVPCMCDVEYGPTAGGVGITSITPATERGVVKLAKA